MQRVAILVDGWNLLKAADRLKRCVNLAELAHAALAHGSDQHIAFQRVYIGPNSGFGAGIELLEGCQFEAIAGLGDFHLDNPLPQIEEFIE